MRVESYNGLTLNGGLGKYATVMVVAPLPYGLPPVAAQMLTKTGHFPVMTGIQRQAMSWLLDIYIRSGGTAAELAQYFDYSDETAHTLTVTDPGGSNPRTVQAICTSLQEVPKRAGKHYQAILRVDGDPLWRKVASPVSWTLVGDGETNVLANAGDADAYPTRIQVMPTSAKTGGYAYRRWIKIKWPMTDGATAHPTDICDDSFNTFALVGGGKMQADGDDLRVWVDGGEVDRWLDGINGLTTKVWVNLDWSPKQRTTLATAMSGAGAVSEIEAGSSILDFPSSGLLEIGSEIFIYTGKNNYTQTFTGVTRAQRGSSAAAHSVGDAVEWIQHDIFILYGNASATAPDVDDDYKPIFDLSTSTNTSWDYNEFGSANPRTGQWTFLPYSTTTYKYTANHVTQADPYSEMGIQGLTNVDGLWYIRHPCRISNVNFQNGEKYSGNLSMPWEAGIVSWDEGVSITAEDSIAEPTVVSTWQSWSDSEAIADKLHVGFYLRCIGFTAPVRLEVADVTLTITNAISVTIGSETANYDLDCTITNQTTGESIRLTFPFLTTSVGAVEVNTDTYTVFEYENNREIYSALSLPEGPRKHWFRLAPGNNTILYSEAGATNCVTLSWIWYERFYE